MKKKCIYIFVMGLLLMVLTACSNTQESVPKTYGVNPTSMEDSMKQDIPDSEYEIDDMLPRPSDDTFIMTVEEAEEFMNRRANIYGDIDEATDMESPDTVK